MSFIAKNPLSLPEINYAPSTPLKGTRGLYPKEDGWYSIDKDGVEKKILDSDDMKGLERLQYYGDINIIPTDVSYFKFSGVDTVNKTISIFGLSDAGLALTPVNGRLDIVIPYKHTIDNIEYTVDYVSLCEVIYDEDLRPSSKYNKFITSIIIPRTIKTIGFGGFCDHSFIRTVDVPDSVTTIGYNAFAGCDNLHEIRLADNVTEIEGNAFNSCPNLTIICSQGSYADTYAKENGIKVKYDVIDADSLNNNSGGTGAVSSVNRKVGDVVLKAEDVGAYSKEEIDSKLSSVYKYKGTIDYYFDLPQSSEVGDVYNIRYASGENRTTAMPKFTYTIYENEPEENMYFIILDPIGTFNKEHLNTFTELNVSFTEAGSPEAVYGFTSDIIHDVGNSIGFYVYGINHSSGGNFDLLFVPKNGEAFINEDLDDITLEEPYKVKDGDNVAWTGTEWDVLGGTEDMSLYAQTDLSNVDNATFKAKAESAGVGGGSGGGNKDFIVNFTIVDESLKCTTDKTFEEVQASIQAGYNVYGAIGITVDDVYGNVKIPLTIFNEYGCWFTGIHLNRSLSIYLTQNGECGAELMHIADNSIYDALERKADKAEEIYEEDVDSQILGENQPKLFKVSRSRMGLMTGFNPYYVYSGEISSAVDGQATKLYQYKITYDGIYFRTGAREPFVAQNNWMEWAAIGSDSIDLSDCEKISNKTTEINADSTDDQYPSAKAVWEVTKNAGGTPTSFSSIILNSSTEGSTKQFKITIDDNGTLTATELEGNE